MTAVLDIEIEGLALREWDMRDLRRRQMGELVARMLSDQGRAPGGARAILRALSAMFEDAITDELAEINPTMKVRVRDGRVGSDAASGAANALGSEAPNFRASGDRASS